MSKETISHYTLQLLLTQKRACLPTLGVLYLKSVGAEIQSQNNKILPPSYKVEFAPSDRISEDQLKSQLLKWDQMTEITADKIVQKITKQLRAGLLSGGVNIDGVGALQNTKDGIEFTQQTTAENPFNPLPELSLTPIERSEDEKKKAASAAQAASASTVASTVAAANKQKETEEEIQGSGDGDETKDESKKKGSSALIPIIAILVLLLLGSAMWFFILSEDEDEDQASVEKQEIVEDRLNVSPSEVKNDKTTVDSLDGEIENEISNNDSTSQVTENTSIAEENDNSNEDTESDTDNTEDSEVSASEEEKKEERQETQQGISENESAQQAEETQLDGRQNSQSSDESETIAGNDIKNQENVRKKSGECIVIVGAFGVSENAERMEEKLRSKGWKVYSNVSVRLRKVGALVPCNRSELLSSMKELRNTIEPNAWIMKDE